MNSLCVLFSVIGETTENHYICGFLKRHSKKTAAIAIDVLWKYDVRPGRHTSIAIANVHRNSAIFNSNDDDVGV